MSEHPKVRKVNGQYTTKTWDFLMTLYKEVKNATEVERRTGVPRNTVRRKVKREGIAFSLSEVQAHTYDPSGKEGYKRGLSLYASGCSIEEVSEITGVPESTLYYRLKNEGLLRSRKKAQRVRRLRGGIKDRVLRTCRLAAAHPTKPMTEIAEMLPWSVDAARKHWNHPDNPYRHERKFVGCALAPDEVKMVWRMREKDDPPTISELAEMFGVSDATIIRAEAREGAYAHVKEDYH